MMWYISLKLNILYNLIYLIKIFYAHCNIQCIEKNYTIMKFYKKHPVITIIMFILILLKTIIVTVVTMFSLVSNIIIFKKNNIINIISIISIISII